MPTEMFNRSWIVYDMKSETQWWYTHKINAILQAQNVYNNSKNDGEVFICHQTVVWDNGNDTNVARSPVSDETAALCCRLLEVYLDAHPEKTMSGCRTSRDGALHAEVKIQNKHDIG